LCRSTMREITKVVSETNAIAAAVRGSVSQNWSLANALIGRRPEPADASFDGNRAWSALLDGERMRKERRHGRDVPYAPS
jgi:hypothetical protein